MAAFSDLPIEVLCRCVGASARLDDVGSFALACHRCRLAARDPCSWTGRTLQLAHIQISPARLRFLVDTWCCTLQRAKACVVTAAQVRIVAALHLPLHMVWTFQDLVSTEMCAAADARTWHLGTEMVPRSPARIRSRIQWKGDTTTIGVGITSATSTCLLRNLCKPASMPGYGHFAAHCQLSVRPQQHPAPLWHMNGLALAQHIWGTRADISHLTYALDASTSAVDLGVQWCPRSIQVFAKDEPVAELDFRTFARLGVAVHEPIFAFLTTAGGPTAGLILAETLPVLVDAGDLTSWPCELCEDTFSRAVRFCDHCGLSFCRQHGSKCASCQFIGCEICFDEHRYIDCEPAHGAADTPAPTLPREAAPDDALA